MLYNLILDYCNPEKEQHKERMKKFVKNFKHINLGKYYKMYTVIEIEGWNNCDQKQKSMIVNPSVNHMIDNMNVYKDNRRKNKQLDFHMS